MGRRRDRSPNDRERRKVEKRRRKYEKQQCLAFVTGYSNEENPFGDARLTERFRWKKKEEKGRKEYSRTLEERIGELQDVKKRREQRESEEAMLEEERERRMREAEMTTLDSWEEEEKKFHAKQVHLRSLLRIKGGRVRPIDILWKCSQILRIFTSKVTEKVDEEILSGDIELNEPYVIIEKLSLEQLKDLINEISKYSEVDTGPYSEEFWESVRVIASHSLENAEKNEAWAAEQRDSAPIEQDGIHSSVYDEVVKSMEGKSYTELCDIKLAIQERLGNPDEGTDVEFWDAILNKFVIVEAARVRLREWHEIVLETRLSKLHEERDIKLSKEEVSHNTKEVKLLRERAEEARAVEEQMIEDSETMMGPLDEALDDVFQDEELLEEQVCLWQDKYRPRKPRYFNRVHTGYQWNAYNRTHYDTDNPPPKIVLGYKFNIFYPDLIDKTEAPTYHVETCSAPDECIIRFSAGPPYEDIAFRILDREWDVSHRRGFRNSFDRAIFHLYFNFKRARYKR